MLGDGAGTGDRTRSGCHGWRADRDPAGPPERWPLRKPQMAADTGQQRIDPWLVGSLARRSFPMALAASKRPARTSPATSTASNTARWHGQFRPALVATHLRDASNPIAAGRLRVVFGGW